MPKLRYDEREREQLDISREGAGVARAAGF